MACGFMSAAVVFAPFSAVHGLGEGRRTPAA